MTDDFTSEWNYGNLYLYVLRDIENECLKCYLNNDFNGWFRWLKSFHRELRRRMKPDERLEVQKLIDEAQKVLVLNVAGARDSYFNSVTIRGERELEALECYLKDIITKRKMDLPSADDPSKALL